MGDCSNRPGSIIVGATPMSESTTEKFGKEPRYPIKEAAILAGTTSQTLRRWVVGSPARGKRAAQPPLIHLDSEPQPGGMLYLSFFNVVEAGFLAAYRHMGVPMQSGVRPAIDYLKEHLRISRPLLSRELRTIGKDLVYEYMREMGVRGLLNVSKSGQAEWREAVAEYLRSVEYDEHGPVLVWMFSERRIVGINPRVGFGYPVIVRNGLRTDVLADRFNAGEAIDEIAEDFSISSDEVEEAIRWENESLRRAA